MLDLIEKLSQAFSPSGNEQEIRNIIINEIKDFVSSYKVDNLGNVIAHKKGNGKKVMVTANMDEIGIMATHIDEKGFIRFMLIGDVLPISLINQKIIFQNGTIGIIKCEQSAMSLKDISISKMYVEIFENNMPLKIGDVATFCPNYFETEDKIISKGLSVSSSCAILIDIIKSIKNNENDLYFAFTVQSNLSHRGIKTATFFVNPDYLIEIGSINANDILGEKGDVSLEKAPVIVIMNKGFIASGKIKDALIDCAKGLSYDYQEVVSEGEFESGVAISTKEGIISGVVCFPLRYQKTSFEVADINALKNTKNVVQNVLNKKF